MLTAARLRLGGVRTLRHALMMINNFRYLFVNLVLRYSLGLFRY